MLPCGSPGNKAAEFHYLDVAGDSHILKHGLYSLAYLYTCLVVIYPDAGLESVWISGLSQKGFCLLRVILISARAEVSEYSRCDDGVSRLSGSAGNGVDNQLAVNGVVNGIPYLLVIIWRLVHVHGNVVAGQGRSLKQLEVGIAPYLLQVIWKQVVSQVHFSCLQGDGSLGCLRDNLHNQLLCLCRSCIVIVKALQGNGIALLPLYKLIWAGTDWMKLEGFLVCLHHCLWNNGCKWYGKVSQSRCIRRLQLYINCIIVYHVHLVDKVNNVGNSGGINGPVQGELYILCLHLRTVVEFHALADVECVGCIGILIPALCNLGLQLSGRSVNNSQRVENLVRNLYSRRLLSLMGI